MSLTTLAKDIYKANAFKGFWPADVTERNFGEICALIHSEVSEMLEASRKDILWAPCDKPINIVVGDTVGPMVNIEEELSDIIIRCLDLAGAYGIDIQQCIHAKLQYNTTRPIKHGKQF